MLRAWTRLTSKEQVSAYLAGTLKSEPARAVELLKHFSNISYGVPLERARFIERNNYHSVTQFVDAEAMYDALVNIYGGELNDKNFERSRALAEAERLAQQFARVHREVESEKVVAGQVTEEDGRGDVSGS